MNSINTRDFYLPCITTHPKVLTCEYVNNMCEQCYMPDISHIVCHVHYAYITFSYHKSWSTLSFHICFSYQSQHGVCVTEACEWWGAILTFKCQCCYFRADGARFMNMPVEGLVQRSLYLMTQPVSSMLPCCVSDLGSWLTLALGLLKWWICTVRL